MLCALLARELSSQFKLTIEECYQDNVNWNISIGYKKNVLRIWQKIAELAGGYKFDYIKMGALASSILLVFLCLIFYIVYAD